MHFVKDPEWVATCRGFVAEALQDEPADMVDKVVLVTSELVSNVILHTAGGGTLELEVADVGLRLVVSDGSHVAPRTLPHGDTAFHGRGLPIISSLADAWGVDETRSGKSIWATFTSP